MTQLPLLCVWSYLFASRAKATSVVSNEFTKSEQGQTFMGSKRAEVSTRSIIQCSHRCLTFPGCEAYQYQEPGPGNCLLIHRNLTGDAFQTENQRMIYEKVNDILVSTTGYLVESTEVTTLPPAAETTVSSVAWIPPSGWSGPVAAFYSNFDASDGLVLMEGTQQMDSVPLVAGKVNSALTLNRTKKQWVDLGVHTEACMTRPETCGAAGGAISLWLRVIDCPSNGGIVSSVSSPIKISTGIYCNDRYTSGYVYLQNGYFYKSITKRSAWTHIVVNYVGPNGGQGVRMYQNGGLAGSDTTKSSSSFQTGNGRVVVGRQYTGSNQRYASVQVDELLFFNGFLTNGQIQSLFNAA